MGKYSSAIFNKDALPERCIIFGGIYVPERMEWIRPLFDKWSMIKGDWVKYSFATKNQTQYLVVFNVYGGATTFELIQILKDGGTKKVFFIGSMGGKDLPIGTIVIPSTVFDKAGLVHVDDPAKNTATADDESLVKLKETLEHSQVPFVLGETASVPCVLHNIVHITKFIKDSTNILGNDLETSTFYYYSQKEGIENYAILYVSDNDEYDLIDQSLTVKEIRKKALKTISRIAIDTL